MRRASQSKILREKFTPLTLRRRRSASPQGALFSVLLRTRLTAAHGSDRDIIQMQGMDSAQNQWFAFVPESSPV